MTLTAPQGRDEDPVFLGLSLANGRQRGKVLVLTSTFILETSRVLSWMLQKNKLHTKANPNPALLGLRNLGEVA